MKESSACDYAKLDEKNNSLVAFDTDSDDDAVLEAMLDADAEG